MIGYEFEFLVREGNEPLTKKTFLKFHQELAKYGWESFYDPGTGGLVGSRKNDFQVTTDDGVSTMELNTPPQNTIGECDRQMHNLLKELQSIYQKLGCSIIDLDTFPGFFDTTNHDCKKNCTNDQCCEKSYIKYRNAQRFNKHHHDLFVVAANHVWLDVEQKNLIEQWGLFNKLSPLCVALFANGPIFNNKKLNTLEGRDLLWHNMLDTSEIIGDGQYFGMPKNSFEKLTDYFNFMLNMPLYFMLREGKSVWLVDKTKTFTDFFGSTQSQAIYFDDSPITISPTTKDFLKIQNLTFPHARIKYHIKPTISLPDILSALQQSDDKALLDCFSQIFIEYRSIGAQPQTDISAGPAFLLGLQQNIEEMKKVINQYPYEFYLTLYDKALISGLDTLHEDVAVAHLIKQLLDIAQAGLKKRNKNEELYLKPLYDRLNKRKNPAQEALEIWQEGGLEALFSKRDFQI